MPGTNDAETVAAWFAERLPADWFTSPLEVRLDKDEILIVIQLAQPDEGTIENHLMSFRTATRPQRMEVAELAQQLWQRKVSWAASCGEIEARFTTASVPVMTRLRMDERQVLDTLIKAGVARSRSEALAWCVQQVGQNQEEWIARLSDAMSEVDRIRAEGPA